jgi:UDP-N-acetyl-D-glucosamine dehydrogenase
MSIASVVAGPGGVVDGLRCKIADRTALVGVIGVGYVGLPLAVEKAKVGFNVIGYDRNAGRVAKINQTENYVRDVADADLAAVVGSGRLRASADFDSIAQCDVVIICVPTPLTVNREPDISHVRSVAEIIAAQVRPGQLICLESTTYPGTTEEILLPLLAASGLVVGRDFFLAFSPERVDPGNKRYTTANTSKIVGGVTPVCLEMATLFYSMTIVSVTGVSSPRVAELCKVFENTFRAVNIALVNELALLCDRMGISIWEVVDAAATKPFGMMRFDPGPGVGGHCIPLDPFYLAWKARQYDFPTRFIELAGEINISMPYFVREKVVRALNGVGRALRNARILLIGMAYKKDIEDWRESPALKVLELLEREGAFVDYHDPLVPEILDPRKVARRSVAMTAAALASVDCVVIVTDHSCIDWKAVARHARLIVDTRNVTRDLPEAREKTVLL